VKSCSSKRGRDSFFFSPSSSTALSGSSAASCLLADVRLRAARLFPRDLFFPKGEKKFEPAKNCRLFRFGRPKPPHGRKTACCFSKQAHFPARGAELPVSGVTPHTTT
jgi:hypothetical protein